MRAISLHRDVIVVTSALLQVNCVVVRGAAGEQAGDSPGEPAEQTATEPEPGARAEQPGETFLIDSPVLPDELDALPSLLQQARFPPPSGLLVTHADWDHLLGRLAFPGVALGAGESTAERLKGSPGEAQRDLRDFDEGLLIERERPLALGSIQALPVPGRCAVGDRELELYAAHGHTPDGMAVLIPWALVLVAGDYLSPIELPTLSHGGEVQAYLATLERLRALVTHAEHDVPGHGPVLGGEDALAILEQDAAYLQALAEHGTDAELPPGRSGAAQRRLHRENLAAL